MAKSILEACESGACELNAPRSTTAPSKETYSFAAGGANDPLNLVVTNRKYNRSKNAKTPMQWMPINREYACKYMKRWVAVKKKYKLPVSAELEKNYRLAKCEEK